MTRSLRSGAVTARHAHAAGGIGIAATLVAKVRALGWREAARRARTIVAIEGFRGLRMRAAAWRRRILDDHPPAISPAAFVTSSAAASESGDAQAAGPVGAAPVTGINLVGHPFGVLGMGEHVRKSAHAFAAAGVPFTLIDTFDQPGALAAKIREFPFLDRLSRVPAFPVSLFHLNADEMPLASAHLGAAFFAGHYNIGYWAWELAKFPDAWCSAFEYFDEIWAPSRFIQQALAEKSPVPVRYMPLAVGFPEHAPLDRAHFRLPRDRFLFLFYFDFTSYVARKNPQATLAAFEQAFPPGSTVAATLVIKLNGMHLRPDDYARFCAGLKPRGDSVILLEEVMTDREVRSLVQCCDAFVSLHRSEGFGRGLAEAMYYGKPVIGTGYSGNLDYMNPDNACLVDHVLVPVREGEYPHAEGQVWADPDVAQAAAYMRALAGDARLCGRLGERARASMREHHGFAAIGRRYRARLAAIGLAGTRDAP